MNTNNMNIRVYPVEEPKNSTLAYATIAIDDIAAIRGVRVVDGKNGVFVTMPQSKDKDGEYHDIAYPLSGNLRKEITAAVLDEYNKQESLLPGQRGYKNTESKTAGRSDDVDLIVKVFPLKEPKRNTLAFASVCIDDTMVISGVRIRSTERGQTVSMPQSKDKDGKFHDIAYPLSADLRSRISKAVLGMYQEHSKERKQGIGEKLAESKEESARLAASAHTRSAVTKGSPRLGD